MKSGWSIVYIEGSYIGYSFQNKIVFHSLKIDFILANDEMLHYEAFHLGLHCLPKYPFRGFQSLKGSKQGTCNGIPVNIDLQSHIEGIEIPKFKQLIGKK